MLFARSLCILKPCSLLLVAVAFARPVAAEPIRLQVEVPANQNREVVALLEARGKLKLKGPKSEIRQLPLEVRGDLKFTERLLDEQRNRSVRWYDKAAAKIKIGEGGAKPSLRESRRLVIAQNTDSLQYRAATGPIRREELDLLRTQGDPLAFAELLPSEPVDVGATWMAAPAAWARVLAIRSVTDCDIEFKLVKLEGPIALISFTGSVDGSVSGVATEIEIRGKMNFDTSLHDITWFAMTMKEKRSIGLAEPGVEASSRLRVAVRHIASRPELTAQALAGAPLEIRADESILEFESDPLGFRLIYEPRWRVMLERPDFAVLRLVEDGALIAQANIARLPSRPVDKPFKLVDFQKDIQTSLDKRFGQFVEATEFTADSGAQVLRVTASGAVEDVSIHWVYYHLTSENGDRMTISFTMASTQAEAFGGSDRTLINSLVIKPAPEPSVAVAKESSDAGSGGSPDEKKP